MLSSAFSQGAQSPFLEEDMTRLALATRAYTVEMHAGDALCEEDGCALDTLSTTVLEAAQHAADPASPKTDEWRHSSLSRLIQLDGPNNTETMEELASPTGIYGLDEDAVLHLADCNRLITAAVPWLIGCALIAFAGIVWLCATRRKRLLSRVLFAAPLGLAALFAGAGICAAIYFDGFFGAFHGVFFPQGNWTFSAQSLLIRMYPTEFWMGMGVIWLACTIAACIISAGIGIRMKRTSAQR